MNPKMLQSAALGGLFTGVLSALPVVSLGNCCCLWIMGGGFLAAYLLQQDSPWKLAAVDALLVGLIAGLIGAVVSTVVGIPIAALTTPFQEQILRGIGSQGDIPPGVRQMIEGFAMAPASLAVVQLTFSLVINAIFAPLGALLSTVFSSRPPKPAGAGTEPPPPPGT